MIAISDPKKFAIRFGILLFIVIAVLAIWVERALQSMTVEPVPSVIMVEVEPGDTLWKLASEHAQKTDIRQITKDMIRLNKLTAEAVITPGQTLMIPVYETSDQIAINN